MNLISQSIRKHKKAGTIINTATFTNGMMIIIHIGLSLASLTGNGTALISVAQSVKVNNHNAAQTKLEMAKMMALRFFHC